MVYYPLAALLLCVALYAIVVSTGTVAKPSGIVGHVVIGGVLGFGASLIVVTILTIVSNSPQGPLALLFYGPVGFAIGEIIGAVFWWKVYLSRNKVK